MDKLLIASGNHHKIYEIKTVLKEIPDLKIFSLKDFGVTVEVVENGNTLQDNAFKKANEFNNVFSMSSMSDDTGLFVDALDGEPGIYSARYSGEDATYQDNRIKLLSELKDIPDKKRNARFISVICFYIDQNKYYFFEGVCKGKIIYEERGENGFGYDPLFVPDGSKKTFAELSDEEKNKISHRGIALQKFREFSVSYFQENHSH